MKTVLVTGGAGFIGVHLVRELLAQGVPTVVLDNFKRARRESLGALRANPLLTFIEADIRDFAALKSATRGCSTVLHLAAQSNVMGAVDDPDNSVTTNVLGTHNVLRAAAEEAVERVVFTSSREVYGDPRVLPVSEDQPLEAKNHYGASKLAGEAYCRSFSSAKLAVEVVRLANVYGPGDSGRVIPLWLDAAQQGHDLSVYGGEQVIDFLWVGKAVEAILFAARHGLPGPVNIGSGVGTRIMELAARILAVTGSSSQVVRTAAREVEVARFVADTTRMRALGLVPEADPLQHLAEVAQESAR